MESLPIFAKQAKESETEGVTLICITPQIFVSGGPFIVFFQARSRGLDSVVGELECIVGKNVHFVHEGCSGYLYLF